MHKKSYRLRGYTSHIIYEDAREVIQTTRIHKKSYRLRGYTRSHTDYENAQEVLKTTRMHKKSSVAVFVFSSTAGGNGG